MATVAQPAWSLFKIYQVSKTKLPGLAFWSRVSVANKLEPGSSTKEIAVTMYAKISIISTYLTILAGAKYFRSTAFGCQMSLARLLGVAF